MYLRSATFFIAFLLHLAPCLAAESFHPEIADPILENWRWQTFPQLEGPGFRAVAEDADGNVWFATDVGVKRYDGLTWTDYAVEDGLHGAPVNVLCAGKDGRVWAGSRRGISVFEDGAWRRVFPVDTNADWTIWSIREASDGTIWSGTARGALCIMPDGEMCYFTTEDCAIGLRVIAPWMTYVVVPAEYVTAAPWGEGIGVKVALGLPAYGGTITSAVIRALAQGGPADRAGVRVGDQLLGANGAEGPPRLGYNGKAGTTTTVHVRQLGESEVRKIEIQRGQPAGVFRDFWIFDVYEDREGAIWFATRTGELIRYTGTPQDPVYTRFDRVDGLDIQGRRPRTQFAETDDGYLWAVTASEGGLNRFDGQKWVATKLAYQGGSDQNQSVSVDRQGTLWVGGEGTLQAYQDGSWRVYREPNAPIPDGRIIVHADRKGGLWVGGVGRGISHVDLGTAHYVTYPNLAFQFQSASGDDWFLSQTGDIVSRTQDQWHRYPDLQGTPVALLPGTDERPLAVVTDADRISFNQLESDRWNEIAAASNLGQLNLASITQLDDGSIWFGTDQAAYHQTEDRIERYSVPSPQAFSRDSQGTIWAAANTELRRLDGDRFIKHSEVEALTRTVSQALLASPDHELWVGTQFFGAFRHDAAGWHRYDTKDGLSDNNVIALARLENGHIIAATQRGYCRFDGSTWSPYLQGLPSARTTGLNTTGDQFWIVTKDGESISYRPNRDAPRTNLMLDVVRVSQPGNTVISWQGVDPWRGLSDRVLYSHRLNGGPWSEFSRQTSRVLLEMDSGRHVLEVRARDEEFNTQITPSQATFSVAPPIWQQPWFLGMVGILLITGITQTVRIVQRDRNLARTNGELESARSDLERRVISRTRELSDANDKLMQEVAERERTERELIHLERLRAVGEMSAGISHNLNNILTGILAPAQVVKETLEDPDQLFYLETVIKSAERATDLVSRLHRAVRGGRNEAPCAVAINQVVLDAVQTARPRWKDEPESRGVDIEIVTKLNDVGHARATETSLHDIVVNLIFNAVDALPEGGTISIRSEETEDGIVVSVSDDGVGMDEDTRGRVFEPFFTTKMDVGTGLGLFTVHGTVRRWNGKILVDSTPGEGTCFEIEIPKWRAEEADPPETGSDAVTPARRCSILVVDDEPVVRDALYGTLSRNHQVTTAEDGTHAIKQFVGGNYDVVFLDLGMPGLPGDAISREFRRADPLISTVLITGWDLDEDDERLGSFDFQLQKPIAAADLENVLSRAIDLRDRRARGGEAQRA